MPDPPLLGHVLPQFATQLQSALASESAELASQLPELRIGNVCRCDDPACATFDVPERRPRDYDYSVELEELPGLVLVDLAKSGQIIGVEVLNRPDLRELLDAHPEI